MKEINKEDFLAIEQIRPKCIKMQNDSILTRPSGSILDRDQSVEKQDDDSQQRASAPNPTLAAPIPKRGTKKVDVVKLVTALPFDLPFKCQQPGCDASFATHVKLGGHMSRAHPSKSENYNEKVRKSQNRETERVCRRLAESFFVKYSQEKPEKHRHILTKIKVLIMKQRGDFVTMQLETAKLLAQKHKNKDKPKAALPDAYYLDLLEQLVSGMHGTGRKFTMLFSKDESDDEKKK